MNTSGSMWVLASVLLVSGCAHAEKRPVAAEREQVSEGKPPEEGPASGIRRAEVLASASPAARQAMGLLESTAASIADPELRRVVLEILKNPAPTFMTRLVTPAARQKVLAQLIEAGLASPDLTVERLFPPLADPSRAPQSFAATTGGKLDKHHNHPGGLAVHTAFNLRVALELERTYAETYGIRGLNRDTLVAATILHDIMKPWCLGWRPDGNLVDEPSLAGTASDHSFAVAEAIHRGLPARVVIAVAAAHDPAGKVGFLRAGSILAGVDPVERGLLLERGDSWVLERGPAIEDGISHLADHDWVLTDPASTLLAEALRRLVRAQAKAGPIADSAVRWASYRILTRVPSMRLYHALQANGDAGVASLLAEEGIPILAAQDL